MVQQRANGVHHAPRLGLSDAGRLSDSPVNKIGVKAALLGLEPAFPGPRRRLPGW